MYCNNCRMDFPSGASRCPNCLGWLRAKGGGSAPVPFWLKSLEESYMQPDSPVPTSKQAMLEEVLRPKPEAPHRVSSWPKRLAFLLLLALLAAVVAAALARSGMSDPDTPAAPTWPQLLAHLLMLQDIVDQPALSAGIWYVAIDLQLFGLLAALAALAHGSTRRAQTGTTPAAIAVLLLVGTKLASVAWFNLEDDGDMWAPYFFGAYGLGVLAAWGARSGQRAGTTALLASLVLLALLLEWRSRLALAGLVAVLLLWQPWGAELARSRLDALMQWLARISYAVFLLHYPVSLAVSTVVMWAAPSTPAAHVAGLVLTWLLSLAAGWLATRWLEARPAGMRGAAPA